MPFWFKEVYRVTLVTIQYTCVYITHVLRTYNLHLFYTQNNVASVDRYTHLTDVENLHDYHTIQSSITLYVVCIMYLRVHTVCTLFTHCTLRREFKSTTTKIIANNFVVIQIKKKRRNKKIFNIKIKVFESTVHSTTYWPQFKHCVQHFTIYYWAQSNLKEKKLRKFASIYL